MPTCDEWWQMPLWAKALFLTAAAFGFAATLAIELISYSGRA